VRARPAITASANVSKSARFGIIERTTECLPSLWRMMRNFCDWTCWMRRSVMLANGIVRVARPAARRQGDAGAVDDHLARLAQRHDDTEQAGDHEADAEHAQHPVEDRRLARVERNQPVDEHAAIIVPRRIAQHHRAYGEEQPRHRHHPSLGAIGIAERLHRSRS